MLKFLNSSWDGLIKVAKENISFNVIAKYRKGGMTFSESKNCKAKGRIVTMIEINDANRQSIEKGME